MAAGVKGRVYTNISVGLLIYLVIGAIVAISQDYWDFTEWDGHVLASFLTAMVATVFWPISIFYTFALFPR